MFLLHRALDGGTRRQGHGMGYSAECIGEGRTQKAGTQQTRRRGQKQRGTRRLRRQGQKRHGTRRLRRQGQKRHGMRRTGHRGVKSKAGKHCRCCPGRFVQGYTL